jgi:MerR family transcriptional regulator, copper efflux regulator
MRWFEPSHHGKVNGNFFNRERVFVNIGQASKASGVSAKMIRYYESTGLIPPADRRESGYRDYGEADLHRLAFVRRARELGFTIETIRELLELWSDRTRSNTEVRAVALKHVAGLEAQAQKLQDMITTLHALIGTCKRGGRQDCPIMSELGGGAAAPDAHEAARSKRSR